MTRKPCHSADPQSASNNVQTLTLCFYRVTNQIAKEQSRPTSGRTTLPRFSGEENNTRTSEDVNSLDLHFSEITQTTMHGVPRVLVSGQLHASCLGGEMTFAKVNGRARSLQFMCNINPGHHFCFCARGLRAFHRRDRQSCAEAFRTPHPAW